MEYLRAGLGMAFTLGPFAAGMPLAPIAGVLAALAALFAVFGVRTWVRHRTRIRLTDEGLAVEGLRPRRLPWDGLTRCALDYYSTKRDRRDGWMQLKLKAEGRSLKIDSQIEGFETLVGGAARAARARALTLDAATVENLRAIGIAGEGGELADAADAR